MQSNAIMLAAEPYPYSSFEILPSKAG